MFRVHLKDGSKFDTDKTPDQIQLAHAGQVVKIKKLKNGQPQPPLALPRRYGLATFQGRKMKPDDAH